MLFINKLQNISIFALNQRKGGLRPKESILRACFLSVCKTKVGAQLSLLPRPVLSSPLFSVFYRPLQHMYLMRINRSYSAYRSLRLEKLRFIEVNDNWYMLTNPQKISVRLISYKQKSEATRRLLHFLYIYISRCRYLSSVNVSAFVPKEPAETVNLKLNVKVFEAAS